MKIISWNINGLRAVIKKGFNDFLKTEQPDILCLQEIKISEETRQKIKFDFLDYQAYWNCAERPGYSGTLVLVRSQFASQIIKVQAGLKIKKFDLEGRIQIVELPNFYLLNVYFPNSNAELSRLSYKLEFNQALLRYVKKLEKNKAVIITGDFNVAHQEIDLARPRENEGAAGCTVAERAWFTKLLASNFLDTFRELQGQKIQYSWWSYRTGARPRNIGWRIDYFCTSVKLKTVLKKAYILDQIQGSDHAPIVLELKD